MAKGTGLSPERAAAWLATVHDDFARLPRAEQRWTDPQRSPIERERDQQATFHEWQATVERFEILASAFLAGNLSAEMAQPFGDVVDQLQRISPTVERLGLKRPPAGPHGAVSDAPGPQRSLNRQQPAAGRAAGWTRGSAA